MTVLTRLLRSSRKALGSRGAPAPAIASTAVDTSPFLLTEGQIRDRAALEQLVREIESDGGTYHQLNLRPDLCIPGEYDMTRYVNAYHVPEDLTGLNVLDVGTASGYFALECARRGADVVAIDLIEAPPVAHIARLADLRIRYVRKSVYDLDEAFGQFDLVICGSLLLHLTDIFAAIRALRTVCRGRVSVSTACTDDSGRNSRPMCDFVATRAADGHYYTYWLASEAAVRQMLLVAGFARVANESHFRLESNEGRQQFATPHVAMTAFVE